jgi:hypothetical protein
MPTCVAKNCNSGGPKAKDSDSDSHRVVLFRFPKKPMIKNRWIRGLHKAKWSPKPNSVLCSLHFEESAFLPGSLNDPLQRPKLKLNAVPTIFDHNKKKTARKHPKDRSATTPAKPNFSSLLPISDPENQQNEEMVTSPDDSGIIAGGSCDNVAQTSSILSENRQDLETVPDDSCIVEGNNTKKYSTFSHKMIIPYCQF